MKHPLSLLLSVLFLSFSALIFVSSLAWSALPVIQTVVPFQVFPLLVVTAVMLARRTWLPAVLCAGALLLSYYPTVTGRAEPHCDTGPELRVFHANLLAGEADADVLADLIERERPDVVSFVEATDDFMIRFDGTSASGRYPHRTASPGSDGPAGSILLSRHLLSPVVAPQAENPAHRTMQPASEVTLPWGRVTVRVMHPYPPISSLRHSWRQVLESTNTWVKDDVSGPVVLAGDFNATRAHPAFRSLNSTLSDGGSPRGWFHPPTWPATSSVPAWAALDHVLTRGFRTDSYDDFVVPGTDHKALSVALTACEAGI